MRAAGDAPEYYAFPLLTRWWKRAKQLRNEGFEHSARVLDVANDELFDSLLQYMNAPVSIATGSELSGLSKSQLRRLVQAGRILNVGERHIMVRMIDLAPLPFIPRGLRRAIRLA